MTDLPGRTAPAMAGFQPDPNGRPDLVNVFDYERVAAERLPPGRSPISPVGDGRADAA